MDKREENIIIGQMKTRCKGDTGTAWPRRKQRYSKQQLRNVAISTAAVFCIGIGAAELAANRESVSEVLSYVTTDFEYDETLGRLQFVSSILPESAMVFLQDNDELVSVFSPAETTAVHTWRQEEPWIEYASDCDVFACSDGEVMSVVSNRDDEYTIRLLHDNGYESVYSGLTSLNIAPYEVVKAGERIGFASGKIAFELRKDGLSVMPYFTTSKSVVELR